MKKQLWQLMDWKTISEEDIDLLFHSHFNINQSVPEEDFGVCVNPLFYALYAANYKAVKALLKRGADPNAVLKSLEECLPDVPLIACAYSPKIRRLMVEYGAKIPSSPAMPQQTPPVENPEPEAPVPQKKKRSLFIPERPKGKMTKEMRRKWAAEFIRHNF